MTPLTPVTSSGDQVHLVVHHGGRDLAGVVHGGESWAAAAHRTCASLSLEPVPLDLSGEVKQFVVDRDTVVAVRAATRGDLDDLVRWRSSDHVRRWWVSDQEPTRENLLAQYAPRLDGMSPTRMYVAEVNGRSIGFVQDYRVGDYPGYALLGPEPDAIGVDYAIGEVQWTGRGLGVRILWAWMQRARRRFPDATSYFAAPDHRNGASLRLLAKAGFHEGLWFDQPEVGGGVTTVVGHTLDVPLVLGAP